MKEVIEDYVNREFTEVHYYNSESEDAINVALETGISDLPGCYVDGEVIEGEHFSRKNLIRAIKNL
jgi:hypothetical protein